MLTKEIFKRLFQPDSERPLALKDTLVQEGQHPLLLVRLVHTQDQELQLASLVKMDISALHPDFQKDINADLELTIMEE